MCAVGHQCPHAGRALLGCKVMCCRSGGNPPQPGIGMQTILPQKYCSGLPNMLENRDGLYCRAYRGCHASGMHLACNCKVGRQGLPAPACANFLDFEANDTTGNNPHETFGKLQPSTQLAAMQSVPGLPCIWHATPELADRFGLPLDVPEEISDMQEAAVKQRKAPRSKRERPPPPERSHQPQVHCST